MVLQGHLHSACNGSWPLQNCAWAGTHGRVFAGPGAKRLFPVTYRPYRYFPVLISHDKKPEFYSSCKGCPSYPAGGGSSLSKSQALSGHTMGSLFCSYIILKQFVHVKHIPKLRVVSPVEWFFQFFAFFFCHLADELHCFFRLVQYPFQMFHLFMC